MCDHAGPGPMLRLTPWTCSRLATTSELKLAGAPPWTSSFWMAELKASWSVTNRTTSRSSARLLAVVVRVRLLGDLGLQVARR